MKRFLSVLMVLATMFLSGCDEETNANRIYVFTQTGCGHCENAHAYMARYYRNYDIQEMNIREGSNINYLMRYAKKFDVPVQSLGTPFIVMGKHYIMGWGDQQIKDFNRYAKEFRPQRKQQR